MDAFNNDILIMNDYDDILIILNDCYKVALYFENLKRKWSQKTTDVSLLK